ncbi:MarR family winged helix-turn-helix transcriptional regulator [Parasphingorhabdus sp.]|uniref:MarR family winged helix-turn-helix transcriptional regulator n=1 Tax=Parasphingorhabdus sp. TaxID=2709688 RepID=UPI00300148B4
MSDRDPLAFKVFNEIGIINQLTSAAFAAVLPKGMTIAQFTVLNHFARLGHEQRSPAQLASAFQITRPTMTSTLARLDKAGLVTIKPDPGDGRSKLVSVTAAGEKMRDLCLQRLAGPMADAVSVLSSETLEALLPLLQDVRAKLDRLRD